MRCACVVPWLVVACGCASGSNDPKDSQAALTLGGGTVRTTEAESGSGAGSEGDSANTSGSADTSGSEGAAETDCVPTLWWFDGDGDGHGEPKSSVSACEAPPGHAPFGDDCDDTDPAVHPAHVEECDGKDNDCDGLQDEASPANGSCHGCELVEYGGHGYAICTGGRTWDAAQDGCQDDFLADLVRVDDNAENAAIVAFASAASATDYWIGATDLAEEGTFRWADNSLVDWADWDSDQPDDYQGEDCVEMRQSFAYRWNDFPCDDISGWICELQ